MNHADRSQKILHFFGEIIPRPLSVEKYSPISASDYAYRYWFESANEAQHAAYALKTFGKTFGVNMGVGVVRERMVSFYVIMPTDDPEYDA